MLSSSSPVVDAGMALCPTERVFGQLFEQLQRLPSALPSCPPPTVCIAPPLLPSIAAFRPPLLIGLFRLCVFCPIVLASGALLAVLPPRHFACALPQRAVCAPPLPDACAPRTLVAAARPRSLFASRARLALFHLFRAFGGVPKTHASLILRSGIVSPPPPPALCVALRPPASASRTSPVVSGLPPLSFAPQGWPQSATAPPPLRVTCTPPPCGAAPPPSGAAPRPQLPSGAAPPRQPCGGAAPPPQPCDARPLRAPCASAAPPAQPAPGAGALPSRAAPSGAAPRLPIAGALAQLCVAILLPCS
mmetsp:Transcript_158231/g.507538  ORF Transcript_158231/g.507538 Transcript_158231/m.507538 type:complete len:305 (+) Transcript_158231:909-1823(+)